MCSPLLLPSEELELPPPMSPMQQVPQRSTPVLPSPQLQRRIPSPGAQYSPAHRPSPMRSSAPTPPRHGRSPFEYIPPTTTAPIAPADAKGVSPVAFSSGYETPIVERRSGTAASRPEPIYDQPIEQRRPSTSTMYGGGAGTLGVGQTNGDEGGSTSGRGTMPPGYGSSPGSSPEFGRPKYRISSMSPGGISRRDQRQQGTDSSPDSGSVQRRQRQFDIRQRSAMGQGHPLLRRLPSSEGQGEEKQSFV